MKIMSVSNEATKRVTNSGSKKPAKDCLLASVNCIVAGGAFCYVINGAMSHHKKKEQNNASLNKQKETTTASSCRMEANEALHTHRMQEGRKRMSTGTNWQNIKSDNCIKRNRGSLEVVTDLRYSWRIFQKTTGGSHLLPKKVRVMIVTDSRINKIRNTFKRNQL